MPTSKTNSFLQKTILILFYALFFLTPLYFRFITEELFEFNKMILVYGFTIGIATVWSIRMIVEKRLLIARSKLDVPLLLFVGVQLLASIISMHPRTSFLGYYSRFHGGFLSTVSYVVLYYAFISTVERKHIYQLIMAFFSSLALTSLWGIFEHFGHSASCVVLTGNFDVSCWVQDVQNRVYASFGQPNWMAAYIIGLIPLLLSYLAMKKRALPEKVLFFITLALAVAALFFTKSRSGFLGLVTGLGVFSTLLAMIWFKATSKKTNTAQFEVSTKHLGIAAGCMLGIAVLFGTPYSPSLSELVSTPTPTVESVQPTPDSAPVVNRLEVGGTDSGEIRKIVWQGAIDVWKRYPLLGSGVETFAYSYYKDRPVEHNLVSEWDFLYNKAHNELLNFLATTGIAGLLTYLAVWAWAGWLAFRALFMSDSTSQNQKLTLIGVLGGLSAIMVSNFFGFSTVTVALLTFIFFAIIAIETDSVSARTELTKQSKKQQKTKQELAGWQYVAATLTILASIFLLAKLYSYWSADVDYATGKTLLRSGDYEGGISHMQAAIEKSPNEALFYDTFSTDLAGIAVSLAQQGEATAAAQVAQSAIVASDTAISLNDAHLNFYKTRTRMFITLSQLEPSLLLQAKETLEAATERAPSDPKLYYNLGVVESSLGNQEKGIALLEKAVELKPNYPVARLQLGKEYTEMGMYDKARLQFEYILESIDPVNQSSKEQLQIVDQLEATASATQE